MSETKYESKSFTIPFYGNPLNFARELYSNGCNRCCGYQKCAYEQALEIWVSGLWNPYTKLVKIHVSSALNT
jgi:hypothetical protein